jgi:hypothetical protein
MNQLHVIDTDPELLARSAAAATHAAAQASAHMEAEAKCIDESGFAPLLATLTEHEPYAWAIKPELLADGSVRVPVETTRAGVERWYRITRGQSNVLGFDPLIEVRGNWYTFAEGISRGRSIETGVESAIETVLLLPVTSGPGITGELCWWRMEPPGEPAADLQRRRNLLARHDRLVEALRTANADALLDTADDGFQSAVRDYVADTGTLVSLDGRDAHLAHYRALFDRYEICSVELLDRVVQAWFVFAELRFTVRPRQGVDAGRPIAFHTAEFFIPGADERFIARIGHGTDPAAVSGE